MWVKEASKIHNLLQFPTARMEAEDDSKASQRQMLSSGVPKSITCVEMMKRHIGGLHQVSKLFVSCFLMTRWMPRSLDINCHKP